MDEIKTSSFTKKYVLSSQRPRFFGGGHPDEDNTNSDTSVAVMASTVDEMEIAEPTEQVIQKDTIPQIISTPLTSTLNQEYGKSLGATVGAGLGIGIGFGIGSGLGASLGASVGAGVGAFMGSALDSITGHPTPTMESTVQQDPIQMGGASLQPDIGSQTFVPNTNFSMNPYSNTIMGDDLEHIPRETLRQIGYLKSRTLVDLVNYGDIMDQEASSVFFDYNKSAYSKPNGVFITIMKNDEVLDSNGCFEDTDGSDLVEKVVNYTIQSAKNVFRDKKNYNDLFNDNYQFVCDVIQNYREIDVNEVQNVFNGGQMGIVLEYNNGETYSLFPDEVPKNIEGNALIDMLLDRIDMDYNDSMKIMLFEI